MKKITRLILLLLVSLTLQGCENDDDISQNGNDPGSNANDLMFQNENFGNVTTGKFIGLIKNEAGENLSNVQITIGNSIALTDQNGFFIINDAEVFENFAYIKAYKDGYVNGSRVVVPKTDGVNRINIVLLKKEVTATINSGESSVVSLSNGVTVGFNGDFITSDGSPYNGQVEVVLHSVVPNSNSSFAQMPGSLFAQTTTNVAVGLESYGMFSVNLLSPSGEQLNISENSSASITFPIDSNQLDSAPDTIPLWYFDETVGYWKEEGQAIKSNNKYFGLVSHFSWWNCDIPYDYVNLCFTINSGTTDASTPYVVEIKHNTNQLIFSGDVLSQDGEECGFIPQNEDITISIYSTGQECNYQLVHEQVLGPYSSDSSVNISFSEEFQTTTLSGTVTNCNGTPLTNGYAFIDEFNTFSITDGIINIGLQHCTTTTTHVQIFDFDTSQWTISNEITLNGEIINLGSLSTCEDIGGIFNGNVTLTNQAEVNEFGVFSFVTVDGDLRIGGENSDIVDLTPLEGLSIVNDNVSVFANDNLESLNGLQNLVTIGNGLFISNNALLTSISDLNNINSLNRLSITNNDALTSLEGLNNLSNIDGSLTLEDNDALTSIAVLGNLSNSSGIYIENNDALTTLVGLEQITEISFLWITYNEALIDLNGLDNLTSINVSPFFSSIQFLIGLKGQDDGTSTPAPNPNLSNFCALENLLVNGNGLAIPIGIANNAYNPSSQDIIDGNCVE
ncbi:leucine-rich repeat domain-containing protein [Psychroserpens luteus]|uniref:Carboxypeptidase regulatory-like domain-containing protein n=1 Tax=Psychroserpens luteus TaxID=1434066 RepID=A0ABW5ZMY0_9FLAO|nr:hypothetical protein [Psychroserpens luteus]